MGEKRQRCEYCGRDEEDVDFREDPYDSDINDDHTKHWICNTCCEERADDI